MAGEIDMGHARRCCRWLQCCRCNWRSVSHRKALSVREAERLVQREMSPPSTRLPPKPDRDLLRLQEELSDTLGATVAIKTNKKGAGKLMIDFSDLISWKFS